MKSGENGLIGPGENNYGKYDGKPAKKEERIQYVDARFGDHWIDHALKNYTPQMIAEIAMTNGRKANELSDGIKQIIVIIEDLPKHGSQNAMLLINNVVQTLKGKL